MDVSRRPLRRHYSTAFAKAPLPKEEIDRKFDEIVGEVADDTRCSDLAEAAGTIVDAPSVERLASLLAIRPKTIARDNQA